MLIFYKDILKSRFVFHSVTAAINAISCTKYLPALRVAFQRKITEGNEQPLIQGNTNLMNAVNIPWIVARISRTSQCVILH